MTVVSLTLLLSLSQGFEIDGFDDYFVAPHHVRQTLEEARRERINTRLLHLEAQEAELKHQGLGTQEVDESIEVLMQSVDFDARQYHSWRHDNKQSNKYFNAASFHRNALKREMGELASTTSSCTLPDRCAPHGVCMEGQDTCACFQNSVDGHWKGTSCDDCVFGWAGPNCTIECEGGACEPCGNYGQCSQGVTGDGTCSCFADSSRGFFGGYACSQCAPNYFGPECLTPCPGALEGRVCAGRGTCYGGSRKANGTCQCITGYGSDSGCTNCDAAHFGPSCSLQCDGFLNGLPCSGHGKCFNGTSGNGTCSCDPFYGGQYCELGCPNNGCGYGLNGTCNHGIFGNGTCSCFGNLAPPNCSTCLAQFTGPMCSVSCAPLIRDGNICSDNGVCIVGLDGVSAVCSCSSGYYGVYCQLKCTGDPPCSGHGNCSSTTAPVCTCFRGWDGPACDVCAAAYANSTNCDVPCPIDSVTGKICSGQGICIQGKCFCSSTSVCGDVCNKFECSFCPAPYELLRFGPNCANCPGLGPPNAVTQYACSGHGSCSFGKSGTGLCYCSFGYTGLACDQACPAASSADAICSGVSRGTCVLNSTSQPECKCRGSFTGRYCESSCPAVDGAVCNGAGTCNSTTSTCSCLPAWTGDSCDIPCMCNAAHGYCNLNTCRMLPSATGRCTDCICYGNFTGLCFECKKGTQGVDCSGSCVNGTTVGTLCICNPYFGTESCSVQCPIGNNGIVCSGHGNCSDTYIGDGRCHCDNAAGYFGLDCGTYCDPTQNCSKLVNSQCNTDTGACECGNTLQTGYWKQSSSLSPACDTCSDQYWGPSCSDLCDCSGHGSCDRNTGLCFCYASSLQGYYSGTSCDTCAVGYIGDSCNIPSVLVTVLSREQLFANATALPINLFQPPPQSPSYATPRTPVLMIDDADDFRQLYVGGLPVVVFDATFVSQRSEFVFAGSTAVNVSTINQIFGSCGESAWVWRNVQTGVSVADNENSIYFLLQPGSGAECSSRGVWIVRADRGITSDVIWQSNATAVKKFGCTELIADVSCDGTRIVAATSQSNTGVAQDKKLFRDRGNLLAFVVSKANNYSSTSGQQTQQFGGRLVVVSLGTRGAVANATNVTLPPDFFAQGIAVSPQEGDVQVVAVSGYRSDNQWDVLTWSLNVTATMLTDMSSWRAKVTCWPRFENTALNQSTCTYCREATRVQLLSKESMLVTFRAESALLNDSLVAWIGGSRSLYPGSPCSNAPAGTSFSAAISLSNSGTSTPTALAYDPWSGLIFMATRVTGSPSVLSKFVLQDISRITLNGIQSLVYVFTPSTETETTEVIASLAVGHNSRLLYSSTTGLSQVRVGTYLLYEISTIEPKITSTSGTVLTLSGRGFSSTVRGGGNPTCFFNGALNTTATVKNSTTAYCTVAATASIDSSQCQEETLELSMFNKYFGATANGLRIERVNIPAISSVFPTRGNYSNRTITLSGVDFVNSTYSQCRFTRNSGGNAAVEYAYGPAKYVDPSTITCQQPTISSTNFTTLALTLDSQVYSAPIEYIVVGAASNIVADPPSVVLNATSQYVSFNVSIFTVDTTNHRLNDLDSAVRNVLIPVNIVDVSNCSEAEFAVWRRPGDTFPYPPCRSMLLNLQSRNQTGPGTAAPNRAAPNTTFGSRAITAFNATMAGGSVTFQSQLFFFEPRTSTLTLNVYSSDWACQVTVTILPGNPYALRINNLNSFEGTSKIAIPLKVGTPLAQIFLYVVDSFANVITGDNVANVKVEGFVYFYPDNCSFPTPTMLSLPPAPCRSYEGNFSSVYTRSSDSVPFTSIVLPKSIHGADYYISFNTTNDSSWGLQSVATPSLRTQPCGTTQFKNPLTSECLDCPTPGGICDGSETIKVAVGYWRAPLVATEVYPCDKLSPICNGSSSMWGSTCQLGSDGPLCASCAVTLETDNNTGEVVIQYWGRTKLTDCAKCDVAGINDLLFAVLIIVVFVAVVIWSFCTLRTETTSDVSVVLRTAVNHMQSMGQLGQLSTRVGPFMKSIFSFSAGSSTLSLQAVQFLDCFQKQHGWQFVHQFYVMMCLPIFAIPIAFTVFGVIRMLNLAPMLSKTLRHEIDAQEQQLGANGAFVSLKRKYPFFMVFTTTISVIVFTSYQTLITQSTSVLQCKEYVVSQSYLSPYPRASKWYLVDDMRTECSSNGVSPYFLPGQLFAIGYGFGIPVTFLFGYRFMNGRLGMPALTNFMFMFLCGGYKERFWYWQALIMIRKLLLVLVAVFVEDSQAQNACGMWILSIALGLQIWLRPAEKEEHNDVEAISLAVITLCLNFGLLYFWPNLQPSAEIALNVILAIITVLSFVIIAVYLITPIRVFLREIRDEIRQSLIGAKQQHQQQLRERQRRKKLRSDLMAIVENPEHHDEYGRKIVVSGSSANTAAVRTSALSQGGGVMSMDFEFSELEHAEALSDDEEMEGKEGADSYHRLDVL